ncbi:RCC1 domain-containing protein [Bdellovibrio sp. HCB2-146]|uniref:RCC1 domain-containing protein n=1 Tax=Bdellovibrio sp. HCB2-146 TaxID=3394362 RepID=UPI0039BCA744
MPHDKAFGRRTFLTRLSALAASSFAATFSKIEKLYAFSSPRMRRPHVMVSTLFGWGNNYASILSVSSAATYASTPCQANTKKWAKVVGEANFSFGITEDGALWYWGNDGRGSFVHGNGVNNLYSSPVRLGTATWTDIALSEDTALAIKSDGTLWGWGRNYTDAFPINVASDAVSLPLIAAGAGNPWVSVSANYAQGAGSNTIGIRSDGYGYVFGSNNDYQLGLGDNTKRSAVVQIGPGFSSAAVGRRHSMFISSGTLKGVGHQQYGALGNGVKTDTFVSTPVTIGAANNWSAVAAGNECTVLIKSTGTLWFTGIGTDGTSGLNNTNDVSTPLQIGSQSTWSKISLMDRHVLAVKTDGSLWTWGKNNLGQLGNGNTTYQSSPVRVGALTTWSQAAAGTETSLGIMTDGSLWAWGDNNNGALGIGNLTSQSSPVRVGTNTWLKAATSTYMSAGVRSDGTLWAWGFLTSFTNFGQVSTPVQIGSDTTWTDVKSGYHYIVAIKSDNSMWNLGTNYYGQLGSSVEVLYSTPVQMGSATNWKKIAMKDFAGVIALKTDNTLWNWGWQIPSGDQAWAAYRLKTPVQVGTGTNWKDIDCCGGNMMALKNDGTLWSWGSQRNKSGWAGSNGDTSTPIQVGTATNWQQFSLGTTAAIAIKTDGTLWSWGDSYYGVLGQGGVGNISTPVQIGTATNWTEIQVRNFHATALRSDKTMWSWGWNDFGQMGNGTTSNSDTPVQITSTKNWVKIFSGSQSTYAIRKL